MADTFETNENLSITPAEAALALHAIKNYADKKGSIGVDTKYLENKLEKFLESRSVTR